MARHLASLGLIETLRYDWCKRESWLTLFKFSSGKGKEGIYIYIIWKTTAWMLGGAARLNMTQALSCLKLETLKFWTYGRGLFGSDSLLSGSGSDISCYLLSWAILSPFSPTEHLKLMQTKKNVFWPLQSFKQRCPAQHTHVSHCDLEEVEDQIRDPSYSCLRILNYLYWRCRGVPFWQVGRSYSDGPYASHWFDPPFCTLSKLHWKLAAWPLKLAGDAGGLKWWKIFPQWRQNRS